MSYEEEFDRLMRAKAEGLDYPFDESHWQKASRRISESRNRTNMWPVGKLVLGTVGVAGIVAAALFFNASDPAQLQKPQVAATAPAEVSGPVSQLPSQPVQAIVAPLEVKAEGGPAKTTRQVRPAALSDEEATFSPIPVEAAQPTNDETAAPLAAGNQAQASSTPDDIALNRNEPVFESRIVQAEPLPDEPVDAEPASSDVVAVVIPGAELSSSEYLAGKKVFLEYRATDPEAILDAIAELKAADDDYYDNKKKALTFYLDLLGGAAYQVGWDYGNVRDGQGPGWYGGVNAGFFLCKKVSIGTGVQAFNVGHIIQPFYTVRSKNYDFGSVTSKTVITCSQLQFIAVPLRLNYHFRGGNQFSIGIYGAQLVRAQNKVESSEILDNSVIGKTTQENNNLYEGMTQQVYMATAGYSLRLCTRFSVSAEVVYGLNELYSANTYMKSVEKPSALRLGITYRILEK